MVAPEETAVHSEMAAMAVQVARRRLLHFLRVPAGMVAQAEPVDRHRVAVATVVGEVAQVRPERLAKRPVETVVPVARPPLVALVTVEAVVQRTPPEMDQCQSAAMVAQAVPARHLSVETVAPGVTQSRSRLEQLR